MGYRAGVGGELAKELGIPAGGPIIFCDRCNRVYRWRGWPYTRPPKTIKGWKCNRFSDGTRHDTCAVCLTEPIYDDVYDEAMDILDSEGAQ